jgi:hypothetical protein
LASGKEARSTPWIQFAQNTEDFINLEYLPPNFVMQDPSRMNLDASHALISHWRDRQNAAEISFRFRQVMDSKKQLILAKYPVGIFQKDYIAVQSTAPEKDVPDKSSSSSDLDESDSVPSPRGSDLDIRSLLKTKAKKGKKKKTIYSDDEETLQEQTHSPADSPFHPEISKYKARKPAKYLYLQTPPLTQTELEMDDGDESQDSAFGPSIPQNFSPLKKPYPKPRMTTKHLNPIQTPHLTQADGSIQSDIDNSEGPRSTAVVSSTPKNSSPLKKQYMSLQTQAEIGEPDLPRESAVVSSTPQNSSPLKKPYPTPRLITKHLNPIQTPHLTQTDGSSDIDNSDELRNTVVGPSTPKNSSPLKKLHKAEMLRRTAEYEPAEIVQNPNATDGGRPIREKKKPINIYVEQEAKVIKRKK